MIKLLKNGIDMFAVDERSNPLVSAVFKHKIAASEASMLYTGPKIPHDEWHKVMSFFRWTHETTKSESQVRGFFDPVDNTIRFWAFPQELGTGMTTKEVDNDNFKAQRASLPNAKDLLYFITVHHHCDCGAFQSGGDQSNEVGQDGLHITVGKMASARHDMDARFYLDRTKFSPKMEWFWDIGKEIADMTPPSTHGNIAIHQMTSKVEMEFPKEWKANLIERKPVHVYRGGMGGHGDYQGYAGGTFENLRDKVERVANACVDAILSNPKIEFDTARKVLEFLKDSVILDLIFDKSQPERFDAIDIRNVISEMNDLIEEEYTTMIEELNSGQDPRVGEKGKKARKRRRGRERAMAQIGSGHQAAAGNGNGGAPGAAQAETKATDGVDHYSMD